MSYSIDIVQRIRAIIEKKHKIKLDEETIEAMEEIIDIVFEDMEMKADMAMRYPETDILNL